MRIPFPPTAKAELEMIRMSSTSHDNRSVAGDSSEQASSRIAGIVLCGGESRRMGRPKLSLPFGPTSLLTRVVLTLKEVVEPVVVVAAADQTLPDDLPASTIITRDERPGLGPLGGLAAGFASLPEKTVAAFVSACDVPLLSADFVRRMIGLLEAD